MFALMTVSFNYPSWAFGLELVVSVRGLKYTALSATEAKMIVREADKRTQSATRPNETLSVAFYISAHLLDSFR